MENAIYAFLGGLILDFAILIEAGRGPKLRRRISAIGTFGYGSLVTH